MGRVLPTSLNPTPQNNDDTVTKSYVDNAITLSGGLFITWFTMQGDIDMDGHEIKGLADQREMIWLLAKGM